MLDICPECGGEGLDYADPQEESCEPCEGSGYLDEVPCHICTGHGEDFNCHLCYGAETLQNVPCPRCKGSGDIFFYPKCPCCRGFKTVPKIP